MRRWLVLSAGVWLCAACTPSAKLPALAEDEIAAERRVQEIAQLRDYYGQLHRLDTVAFRIRTANQSFCKDWVSAQIGLFAATPRSLPRKFQAYTAEALGLRWVRATVISVVDGSPAANAGIVNGDELVSFNGEPVPTTGTMGWMGGFLKFNGERPVTVILRRDEAEQTLVVKPVIGCAIPIDLEINADANAETSPKKIVIQSGVLRISNTDAELALIVGHELAHSTLDHYSKKTMNGYIGAFGGALVDGGFLLGGIYTGNAFSNHFERAGMMAFSVGFEREADYVGAYYAARAGYDIAGAERIWRAMSLENPRSIRSATTHPTSPVRYLQMRKVAEEIADKKRRNLLLMPELKVVQVTAAGKRNQSVTLHVRPCR
jgi:hypothetical protein